MSNCLNYENVYDQSIHQPERFWGEAAEEVQWIRKWDRVFDDSRKLFTAGSLAGSRGRRLSLIIKAYRFENSKNQRS